MIVEDKLGQTATIDVPADRAQRAAWTPADLSFTPPKDVDVIGTPHP